VGASGLAQIAEVVWQLRNELDSLRQVKGARIGLTQNIGGLANNNLVTILERTDFYRPVPVYWQPPFNVSNSETREVSDQPPSSNSGTLETFTTLYTTPEGIPSPLTLGFVRTDDHKMILARGRQDKLEIGQRVELEKEGNLYYFREDSSAGAAQKRMGRWLSRVWSPPDPKEEKS
jgi:hypothetical protein